MRPIWITAAAVSLAVAAAENTRFCTQDEKQLANKLHEQNSEPAKSCYRAANGDITTLATSRLCPLPECTAWLEYMASNSPDCYFDSNNYAKTYGEKNAYCTGEKSTSASGSSNARLHSSSSGIRSSLGLNNGTEQSTGNSNSRSNEDRDLNTTSSLGSPFESSGSDSTGNVEVGSTTVPIPTPTEDLTTEDTSASGTTDASSRSATPAPTTSASSPAPMLTSVVALLSVVFAIGIELM